MLSAVCKYNTLSFTSHIQEVDSTSISSSSILHLFVTQVMEGFLIVGTPAKLGQQQTELRHRGLMKEVMSQKAPCPMDCVVFACYLAWKAKGEEMGNPQRKQWWELSQGRLKQRKPEQIWKLTRLLFHEVFPSSRRDLGRTSKRLRPLVKPGKRGSH